MKPLSFLRWVLGFGASLLLLGHGFAAGALPAHPEQIDVFVGGKDGVLEYRIPGLVSTNQGTLVAFCDARMTTIR